MLADDGLAPAAPGLWMRLKFLAIRQDKMVFELALGESRPRALLRIDPAAIGRAQLPRVRSQCFPEWPGLIYVNVAHAMADDN